MTTPLLRTCNPRIIDLHQCEEWQTEGRRLLAPAGSEPVAWVTAKVESVPQRHAARLAKQIQKHSGQTWCAEREGSVDMVIRCSVDGLNAVHQQGRIPAAEAVLHALEAYQTRRFRIKLPKRTLKLGQSAAVMGILNVTPDSFSDGGEFLSAAEAVDHALAMCEGGADIIDVGGESTRPGADAVSADEEIRRVLPVIEALAARIDRPISIDTFKAIVAREALAAGAQIVNDVTGLQGDRDMGQVVADSGAPLVVMHMRGSPRTMQRRPRYRDVISDVMASLRAGIGAAVAAGVEESQILVDPGIGFGKTVKHNLEIMRRLHEFRSLGRPILMGTSRNSFIGKTLDRPADERIWGSAATVAWAVARGALVVRVHDVRAMADVVRMTEAMALPSR